MPLADAAAEFLRQKEEPVYELPPGTRLHYGLKLIDRCWKRWVMMGRPGELPDIRKIALEDENYSNDFWFYDLIVRWRSQRGKKPPAEDGDEFDGIPA